MIAKDFCRTLAARATTVEGRRALFRREVLAPGYRGSVHLAFLLVACLGPALAAVLTVGSWGILELLAGASELLLSTIVVYFGHRYPMHRPLGRMEIIYDIHTRCHHMMFAAGKTEIDSLDDAAMVMFPIRDIAALCLLGVPLLSAPWLLVGLDPALSFAAVGYLFYLAYELVHLASHGPIGGPLDRVPVVGSLLRHHRRHHAWSVMHQRNFSMLIPVWDWLLGTLDRGES